MELSNVVGIWCAVMSTLQGIGACYALADRRAKKELEAGGDMAFKSTPLITSILLFVGCAVTLVFMTWMFTAKPLRPTVQTVVKTVTVEKLIACPPAEQKTDHASTKGNNSPITTGNGNDFKYGDPKK